MENMRGYQIYIKTENGWKYYGKTPISAQAIQISLALQAKGYKTKIRNMAAQSEF